MHASSTLHCARIACAWAAFACRQACFAASPAPYFAPNAVAPDALYSSSQSRAAIPVAGPAPSLGSVAAPCARRQAPNVSLAPYFATKPAAPSCTYSALHAATAGLGGSSASERPGTTSATQAARTARDVAFTRPSIASADNDATPASVNRRP